MSTAFGVCLYIILNNVFTLSSTYIMSTSSIWLSYRIACDIFALFRLLNDKGGE